MSRGRKALGIWGAAGLGFPQQSQCWLLSEGLSSAHQVPARGIPLEEVQRAPSTIAEVANTKNDRNALLCWESIKRSSACHTELRPTASSHGLPGLPGRSKAAARTSTAAAFVHGALLRFSLKAFCTERTRNTPALLQPAHGARPVPAAARGTQTPPTAKGLHTKAFPHQYPPPSSSGVTLS